MGIRLICSQHILEHEGSCIVIIAEEVCQIVGKKMKDFRFEHRDIFHSSTISLSQILQYRTL
jgi:hypothetical protein